jgi:ribulose 1,5-bisphosphate synthetase/thiazole synthase
MNAFIVYAIICQLGEPCNLNVARDVVMVGSGPNELACNMTTAQQVAAGVAQLRGRNDDEFVRFVCKKTRA